LAAIFGSRWDFRSNKIKTQEIEEVQELANQWLWTYNNERPNMAIRGIPPKHMVELVN
jgi:putative transposase